MQVTYAAPNRAHHYAYATALAQAGVLRAFVSGFSRFSPRADLPEVGDLLLRADHIQNLYLAGLKFRLPTRLNDALGYASKAWIDRLSQTSALKSDLFLYYNGAGLDTARKARRAGVVCVTEAVNAHVAAQEQLMREEYRLLGIAFHEAPRGEFQRRLLEYAEADAILCPSAFAQRSFVEQGVPVEKMVVVHYGFPTQHQETTPKPANGVFRVIYVGQVGIRKGLRYLIKAFSQVRFRPKELLIVGPRAAVTGLEDLEIPSDVIFTGALKGEALAAAYRSGSVFVLPSIEDGFGLVIGEALSYGLPVIASVNTGAADILTEGVEGWLVPIRDPVAIKDKLQALADDPSLAARMSEAALARNRALGGWDVAGRNLVDALVSLSPCASNVAYSDPNRGQP